MFTVRYVQLVPVATDTRDKLSQLVINHALATLVRRRLHTSLTPPTVTGLINVDGVVHPFYTLCSGDADAAVCPILIGHLYGDIPRLDRPDTLTALSCFFTSTGGWAVAPAILEGTPDDFDILSRRACSNPFPPPLTLVSLMWSRGVFGELVTPLGDHGGV